MFPGGDFLIERIPGTVRGGGLAMTEQLVIGPDVTQRDAAVDDPLHGVQRRVIRQTACIQIHTIGYRASRTKPSQMDPCNSSLQSRD